MSVFDRDWIIDNLLAEFIFGFAFFGVLAFAWRYVRDAYKAFWIFTVISTHNNPTRTRRKGIHARDRFMDIFEANGPVLSQLSPYNTGHILGVYNERVVDVDILEHHNLVTITEGSGGTTAEAKRGRVATWVYKLSKFATEHERKRTDTFVTDQSGKYKRIRR